MFQRLGVERDWASVKATSVHSANFIQKKVLAWDTALEYQESFAAPTKISEILSFK